MSNFNICMYCDNMDIENCGYACMVRSLKKSIDGEKCGDFAPNEFCIAVSVRLLKMVFRKVDEDGKE